MEKFAVFRVANDVFGIAINDVVEIIKGQKVFSIPGLPRFLSGVMSVRGAVIPLMDMRRRFGVEPSGEKERILIVRFEGEKIGFLVDEMKEILSLLPDEVSAPPALFRGFRTEYITGLGRKDGSIIILLNIENLLTSEEKIQLKESLGMIEEKGAGVRETAE